MTNIADVPRVAEMLNVKPYIEIECSYKQKKPWTKDIEARLKEAMSQKKYEELKNRDFDKLCQNIKDQGFLNECKGAFSALKKVFIMTEDY